MPLGLTKLFWMKNLLLKISKFILIFFFNKSIRLRLGNVVPDGGDDTIIAK